jgi:hypothetical protein
MPKKKQSEDSPPEVAGQAAGPNPGNSEVEREVLTNKLEGVRRAVAYLGKNATPADILVFIKDRFSIDMTSKMVSSYKSLVLKQAKAKRLAARKPREEAPPPPPPPPPLAKGDVSLRDIRVLKEVGDRLGPKQFRELIDLLYP